MPVTSAVSGPVRSTRSETKVASGCVSASNQPGPSMVARNAGGLPGRSSEGISMRAVRRAAPGFSGSISSSAETRSKPAVNCDSPIWLTEKITEACTGSSV